MLDTLSHFFYWYLYKGVIDDDDGQWFGNMYAWIKNRRFVGQNGHLYTDQLVYRTISMARNLHYSQWKRTPLCSVIKKRYVNCSFLFSKWQLVDWPSFFFFSPTSADWSGGPVHREKSRTWSAKYSLLKPCHAADRPADFKTPMCTVPSDHIISLSSPCWAANVTFSIWLQTTARGVSDGDDVGVALDGHILHLNLPAQPQHCHRGGEDPGGENQVRQSPGLC